MKLVIAALLTMVSVSIAHADQDRKVDGLLCQIEETGGTVVLGTEFFARAARAAQENDTCVVARIKGEESGRVYDRNGRRLGKGAGALSHKEIKEVKAIYGLNRCKNLTCVQRL